MKGRSAALVLASLALLAASAFFAGEVGWALVGALGLVVAVAAWNRDAAAPATLFAGLVALFSRTGLPWPVPIAGALAGLGVFVFAFRRYRGAFRALRAGARDRRTAAATALAVLLAAGLLLAWRFVAEPDLGAMALRLPKVPAWSLLVGFVLFAIFDALLEEVAWRGILFEGLTAGLGGRTWAVIAAQALAYGAFHAAGVPGGWAGAALATAFGLFAGALRARAGGLAAPWLLHFAWDLVLMGMVAAGSGAAAS